MYKRAMYKRLFIGWSLAVVLLAWSDPADAGAIVRRFGLTVFSAQEVAQDARGIAMGKAFTPVVDDVNAIWWNPSGLVGMERAEISLNHSRWFVNSQFSSGAIGIRKGIHAVAVNFMSFAPEEVEETTILEPQGTGRMLDLGTVGMGAAYARRFTDKLSFGVRFMWLRESLDLVDYSTFSIDFGTTFQTGFRDFRLAMSMRNFGKDIQILRREFQQPLMFILAGAGELYGTKGDPFFLTGAFEMNFTVNAEERYHVGGEAWLMKVLALRAGYMFNYDVFSFVAGGGLKVPIVGRVLTMDFAWQKSRYNLEVPLRFSMGIKL